MNKTLFVPDQQDLINFFSKIKTWEDLLNTFEDCLPVISINSKTLSCKMPPFYDKFIKELVEWDRFRHEVEQLLNIGFKSFYTTWEWLRLEWNERGLDFYLTLTNWVWMCIDSLWKYSTHNVETLWDLYIFSHALNLYLSVLYKYLSIYCWWNIHRESITQINKIWDWKIIKLTKITGCRVDSFCTNKDILNCLECVRNPINIINSDHPETLVDNFENAS